MQTDHDRFNDELACAMCSKAFRRNVELLHRSDDDFMPSLTGNPTNHFYPAFPPDASGVSVRLANL